MDFEIDSSLIDWINIHDKITPKETLRVLKNPRSRLRELKGFEKKEFYNIECGYSSNKRILLVASRLFEGKRQLLQIKVADEDEISHFYC